MKRRQILGAALLLPLESLAQTCGVITPRQTEGPFFTPNSPQRISLLEGGEKTRLVLVGTVLSPDCKPMPNALLDFWHSDEQGAYDNRGFRYRGHQHADAQGRYRLETIVPAAVPRPHAPHPRQGAGARAGASSPRSSTFPAILATVAMACTCRSSS